MLINFLEREEGGGRNINRLLPTLTVTVTGDQTHNLSGVWDDTPIDPAAGQGPATCILISFPGDLGAAKLRTTDQVTLFRKQHCFQVCWGQQ